MEATDQCSLKKLLLLTVLLGSWSRVGCDVECNHAHYPLIWDDGVVILLDELASQAPAHMGSYCNSYPQGTNPYIWGYAKCRDGISTTDCFKCLSKIAGALRSACRLTKGGRYDNGNCMVRFEFYKLTDECMY